MSDNINPDHYKRLPVEAIEIIESAIQGATSVEAGYLHGQVLKYVLRCWAKGGIEDLQKAKWYLDRLVESEKRPVIKDRLITEPPDGWRWVGVGETFCEGDTINAVDSIPTHWVGTTCIVKHVAFRRNKFKVGDRVRVCKPGSLLDGKIGRVDRIHWTVQIEVSYEHAWELFQPSELQPVEAVK